MVRTRRTINIDKLTDSDIGTNDLQEIALLLLQKLASRADNDLAYSMEKDGGYEQRVIDAGHEVSEKMRQEHDRHEAMDRKRRDDLKNVYNLLKAIPPRQEEYRFRGK